MTTTNRIRACFVTALILGSAMVAALPSDGVAAVQEPGPGARSDGPWVGAWEGALDVGGQELRIVIHVRASGGGGLEASMDSPDQGATGIPVASVATAGDSIRLDLSGIGASYTGRLLADGSKIEGEWRQGGAALPLVLERGDGTVEPRRRPQEPEAPYPYGEETVTIDVAGATLEGTLTLPPGDGPVPAVVLVSGSGAQDRDEFLAGHRPFLVLADRLTRSGIAVLRMDDRGVGGSTGSTFTGTIGERADDVLAMVRFLAGRPDIDAARIGLLGHSEGGWVVPVAAVEAGSEISFLVLMAGPAQSPRELILSQQRVILGAGGATEETILAVQALNEAVFRVLLDTPDDVEAAARIQGLEAKLLRELPEDRARALEAYLASQPEAARAQQRQVSTTPWFRDLVAFDPDPWLRDVRQPVIALFGERDVQVPPAENAAPMARILDVDHRSDRTVTVLPGLNHLLQPSETGLPSEYGRIETTIAPAALELIRAWIVDTTGALAP